MYIYCICCLYTENGSHLYVYITAKWLAVETDDDDDKSLLKFSALLIPTGLVLPKPLWSSMLPPWRHKIKTCVSFGVFRLTVLWSWSALFTEFLKSKATLGRKAKRTSLRTTALSRPIAPQN